MEDKFASLHGGLIERASGKSPLDGDTGKAVKAMALSHMDGKIIADRASPSSVPPAIPPNAEIWDRVVFWSDGSPGGETGGETVGEQDNARTFPEPALAPNSVLKPVQVAAVVAVAAGGARIKQKRKSLTLRLEQESHQRLRTASSDLGRSYQDILHTAMSQYLANLGFWDIEDDNEDND